MSTVTDDSPAEQPLRRTYGSHVSRVLAKAGFVRGEIELSSMRNMNYYSPGFLVKGSNQSWETSLVTDEERDAGYVTVERLTLDTHGQEKDDPRTSKEITADEVAAYAVALEDAGFEVEIREKAYSGPHLVVKGRH